MRQCAAAESPNWYLRDRRVQQGRAVERIATSNRPDVGPGLRMSGISCIGDWRGLAPCPLPETAQHFFSAPTKSLCWSGARSAVLSVLRAILVLLNQGCCNWRCRTPPSRLPQLERRGIVVSALRGSSLALGHGCPLRAARGCLRSRREARRRGRVGDEPTLAALERRRPATAARRGPGSAGRRKAGRPTRA